MVNTRQSETVYQEEKLDFRRYSNALILHIYFSQLSYLPPVTLRVAQLGNFFYQLLTRDKLTMCK